MSINWWVDEQTVAYNETLLSNKKDQTSDTLKNLDKSQKHYTKWKKRHERLHTIRFHLKDSVEKARI